ncbi:MAG: DUF4135 domain-containing protein [Sandaracinaceae bacterium]|nr:DUF4135 domain-containing protein [Sandaracinaceae bacterium]
MTDCHVNNVRASGADLVLIDAETTLHPDFHPQLVPWTQPEDSVLRSGLIHTLRPLVRDGAGRDAVLGGFERAWRAVASDVSLQRGLAERIGALAEHESRVVFRATQAYSQLLARSLSPLPSGPAPRREDLLRASLGEPFGVTGIPRPLRPLVERELLALGALDVPRFTAMPGGVDVYDAGERVAEGCCDARASMSPRIASPISALSGCCGCRRCSSSRSTRVERSRGAGLGVG